MATIAQLSADLVVNSAKFTEGMTAARTHVTGLRADLQLIKFDSIVNLGERAYQAGQQIYGFAREMASAGSDIERTSGVLGMSITEFQQLSYAAKMADVEQQQFTIGIRGLVKSMQEAVVGTGDGSKAFTALGISVKNSSGDMKPLKTILEELAGKFETYADGPEKLALAYALFGQRGGEAFIAWLNKGKEAMAENAKVADSLGLTTEQYVKQLADSETGFKTFEAGLTALKMQASPLVALIGELLSKWGEVAQIQELSKQTDQIKDQTKEAQKLLTLKTMLKEMDEQGIDTYKIKDYKLQYQLNAVVMERRDVEKQINEIIGKRVDELESMKSVESPQWVKDWVKTYKPTAPAIPKETEKGITKSFDYTWSAYADQAKKYNEIVDGVIAKNVEGAGSFTDFQASISTGWEYVASEGEISFKKYNEQLEEVEKSQNLIKEFDWEGVASGVTKLSSDTERSINLLNVGIQKQVDSLQQVESVIESFGSDLSSSWTTNVTSMLKGTETFSDGVKKLFEGIGDSFISTVAKMITQWFIFGSITGKKEEGGGFLTGGSWGGILGSVTSIFGSFQGGTDYVSQTGLYQLHQGEAVIPPGENKEGRGGTTVVYIEATDVQSFERKYGSVIDSRIIQGKRFHRMSAR